MAKLLFRAAASNARRAVKGGNLVFVDISSIKFYLTEAQNDSFVKHLL